MGSAADGMPMLRLMEGAKGLPTLGTNHTLAEAVLSIDRSLIWLHGYTPGRNKSPGAENSTSRVTCPSQRFLGKRKWISQID